jgi:hypothetical protein
LAFFGAVAAPQARADFLIGDASNFGVLYEGTGGHTLQITNVTVNGNMGIGGTGKVNVGGPAILNGALYFSAGNTGQFSGTNFVPNPATLFFNSPLVTSALNTINNLSSTLGAEQGTQLTIGNGGATIDASKGKLDASGNRVFTVTSFSSNVGDVLTILGDGHNVVFNFATGGNINFGDLVHLSGGLDTDSVLWNLAGTGKALSINTNASSFPNDAARGIFLDPNGTMSVVNANVVGRVFGGDSSDMNIVSGTNVTSPGSSVVPAPSTAILVMCAAPLLSALAWRRRRGKTPGLTHA